MDTAQSHTPGKILVVEDDAALVRALAEYLRREGFDVSAASGEQEARDALAHRATAFNISAIYGKIGLLGRKIVENIIRKGSPQTHLQASLQSGGDI